MRTEQTNQLVRFAWREGLTAEYEDYMSLDNPSWSVQKISFDRTIAVINHTFKTDYFSIRELIALQKRFLNNAFCQEHHLGWNEFDLLFDQYTESHRFYHTLDHLIRGFEDLDQIKEKLDCPNLVELAFFYHDVCYDTHAKDNEERSYQMLLRETKSSLTSPEREALSGLILGTKSHQHPANSDQAYLMDIDLRVMGGDSKEFHKYGQAIRQEYSWVPADVFVYHRKEFLEEFIRRPIIFNTDYFRDKYEHKARENLQNEIDHLKQTDMA
ncbi:MAG: hypothetical protein WCV90_02875 [Candidatus Woesearchaeota archaeon]|jgi:predicted metal-dependent HD superfamily phosphohydrolase